jgi:CheY-like chemotaxis protein
MVVEDNLADAELITEAFQDGACPAEVVHISDCERALRYLCHRPGRLPALILLALRLTPWNGLRFLEAVKADERLKMIPVLALAESSEPRDVSRCYTLGIAGYVVKPRDRASLREGISTIRAYWTLSRLPRMT